MMTLKRILLCTCLSSLALPVHAQDAPRPALKPRVEANLRAGTERSIAMSEFWVPLAQDSVQGSVLYGDARFMGDDKENNEFNLGVGYREIVTDVPVLGNGVAGVHGWVDRRHTERGAAFNQITAGAEWHGEVFDIKANAYIPLNKSKTHAAGTTTTAPYLAGSGIFYDITNMKLIEEAQPGFDLELGLNVSGIVDGFADSARIYAGAYHFSGDKSDDVTGWRTRIASDITQDVQIGARFQRDDERGSQGFLEATIRFPFGNKQSYKQHGLYARLDESPERDIDIVTSATRPAPASAPVVTPVLNATSGDVQRVLYVDNSAAGGGTGTLNNPFNSLADAQADLRDNDVVYVARGDGLTTNMNTGFTINRAGVSLIGEGSNFVYDGGKFTTSDGVNFSGTLLKTAGLAPTITNGAGDGILVSAPNAMVSGITVNGAQRYGIYGQANAANLGDLRITNVTANGNNIGVHVQAENGGIFDSVYLSDLNTHNNTASSGVTVTADGGGYIGSAYVGNVISNGNFHYGLNFFAGTATNGSGRIDNVIVDNLSAAGNNYAGLYFRSREAGSMLANVTARNIVSNNNVTTNGRGVYILSQTAGVIENVSLDNITASGNVSEGLRIEATSGGARISGVTVNNASLTGSTGVAGHGFYARATTGTTIDNVLLNGIIATGNSHHGVYFHALGTASLTAAMQHSMTTGNTQHGVVVYDDTSGTFEVDLGGGGRSAGRNTLMGNTLEDLAVDYDGRTMAAMNNWWGQASGPYQSAPSGGLKPQIYYGAPMNDGLIAHWTFDQQWTSAAATYDRMVNHYAAAFSGGMSTGNLVSSNRGEGLNFNGTSHYLEAGDILDMGTNDMTFLADINAVSSGGTQYLLSKSRATAQNFRYGIGLTATGQPYPFFQGNGGPDVIVNAGVITDGAYHQLGVVFDRSHSVMVYDDGVQEASTSIAHWNGLDYQSNNPFRIGAYTQINNVSTMSYYQGIISDLRVYNRTLTTAEMNEINRMSTDSVVNFGGFMGGAP